MNLNKFRRQARKDSEMCYRRTKELAQKTIPEALNKEYGEIKVTDSASHMFYLTRLFNFIEHNERIQIGDGMDYQGFWEFAARWVNEQEKKSLQKGHIKIL